MWPDWVSFERSRKELFLPKWPKYLSTFWAILKSVQIVVNVLLLHFGQLSKKFAQFLCQHLVTLLACARKLVEERLKRQKFSDLMGIWLAWAGNTHLKVRIWPNNYLFKQTSWNLINKTGVQLTVILSLVKYKLVFTVSLWGTYHTIGTTRVWFLAMPKFSLCKNEKGDDSQKATTVGVGIFKK